MIDKLKNTIPPYSKWVDSRLIHSLRGEGWDENECILPFGIFELNALISRPAFILKNRISVFRRLGAVSFQAVR